MQNHTFIPGQDYTRRQIHQQLRGSLQSYLPTVDGTVVCACLRTDLNRKAPDVILVGFGSGIQRGGRVVGPTDHSDNRLERNAIATIEAITAE